MLTPLIQRQSWLPNPMINGDGQPVAFSRDEELNENWAKANEAFWRYVSAESTHFNFVITQKGSLFRLSALIRAVTSDSVPV
jgi:hypothetical protein